MTRYQAVYVTGAPGSGKTTLIKHMQDTISPLKSLEYSDRLLEYLRRDIPALNHEDLRARASELVTPGVVAHLDEVLVNSLPNLLENTHIVLGSHAVNHENYGVRVTAFKQGELLRLPFSAIVVLECPVGLLVERIAAKSEGRTWRTKKAAERLQRLQITLALQYGTVCGCPVLVIDAEDEPEPLATKVIDALRRNAIFLADTN